MTNDIWGTHYIIQCGGSYGTEDEARATNASLARQGIAEIGGTNCPICAEPVELVKLDHYGVRIAPHTLIAYQVARDCPNFD